jgi:hypothetical protein
VLGGNVLQVLNHRFDDGRKKATKTAMSVKLCKQVETIHEAGGDDGCLMNQGKNEKNLQTRKRP